ncbi:MAG: hypothetical protein ACI4JB_07505 [Porcipelethomonas sp.]
MNIISVIIILVISAVLLAASSCIFLKIFGRGIFSGSNLSAAVVIDINDDAEEILGNIAEKFRTELECTRVKIIIIDGGMSVGQREICRRYCDMYNFFIICTPDNLSSLIFKLQKNS